MNRRLFAACLAAALLCGCSVKRATVRYASGLMNDGMPAYLEEEDVQTAKETLLSGLKLSEALLQSDPENKELLRLLSQGYCGYAFMFLEDSDAKRASGFYRKGAAFSMRALGGEPEPGKIKRAQSPELFWNCFCRAGYAQLNLTEPDALADIPKVQSEAEIMLGLDSSYYYNGAHAILGTLYAMRPKMFGGDTDKAKTHFDAAFAGDGAKFLPYKLLYAKTYAVQIQDRELFESVLKAILSGGDILPRQRLANNVAREKAAKLLETANDRF